MSYGPAFYDLINEGSLRSARHIVPRVLGLTGARTVVDFGCGEGAWLSVFAGEGCSVYGFDGPYVDTSRLLIDRGLFEAADLEKVTEAFIENGAGDRSKYDLAISLEVAEHLDKSAANQFVEALTLSADVVLFSAAIPGQGGVGHINEQWPGYWAEKFMARGFVVTGALREEFWDLAIEGEVENWYAQNLLLCVSKEEVDRRRKLSAQSQSGDKRADFFALAGLFLRDTPPKARVHPVLWESRL